MAQKAGSHPYYELPEYSESFTAGTVASRLIDGLRKEDLEYRPTLESRSVAETIDHIHGMTSMVLKSVCKIDINPTEDHNFEEKRAKILMNLKSVSAILKTAKAEEFENFNINLRNHESVPFWFFINGQITDSIWHCGQISSFRRITGNPISSKVSFFRGEVKD
ncbi:hypothetical protein DXU93_04325 [Brumimicrobium aurantiacum]|uniref:DinB family protein n=2 Tax=Brumimicrobium aurantiacum TaxID=1737063 RepID=A0A3E1EZZ8_9FLAO|nr:hypothetical protein DXU93_04325 [Brumimicrobium aurantiacum]